MSLLQELHDDFEVCRKEFKDDFPNVNFDWDYAMEKFNDSKYAKENWYSWPVYSEEGYNTFIKFVKEELL